MMLYPMTKGESRNERAMLFLQPLFSHRVIVQNGKAYCCEACATGHRNGELCRMSDCKYGELAQSKEPNVDNALDEAFPASDPISP